MRKAKQKALNNAGKPVPFYKICIYSHIVVWNTQGPRKKKQTQRNESPSDKEEITKEQPKKKAHRMGTSKYLALSLTITTHLVRRDWR